MKALAKWGEWLDDRMNAVVVKELRQAVRSRLVLGLLIIFLIIQLSILAFSALKAHGRSDPSRYGRESFMWSMMVLQGACVIFVPLYIGSRLAQERPKTGVDLLYISALRPRSIVFGKTLVAVVIAAPTASASAPFLTFTYLLRGVDLPTVFLLIVAALVGTVVATQFAVFIGCLPVQWMARAALGFGVFIFGWGALGFVGRAVYVLMRRGTSAFWSMSGGLFTIAWAVFATGLCTCLAVAALSPPASNRALVPRIWVTAWCVVTGAAVYQQTFASGGAWVVWYSLWASILGLAMFVSISERDDPGRRVRRRIPKRGLARLLAFLFYSGSAGGVTWVCVLMAGAILVTVTIPPMGVASVLVIPAFFWQVSVASSLYVLAYALTGLLLWRHLLRSWFSRQTVGLWGFLIGVLACVLPPIVVALLEPGGNPELTFLPGSPFQGFDGRFAMEHLLLAGVWAAVAFWLNAKWYFGQWRAFRREEPKEAGDAG